MSPLKADKTSFFKNLVCVQPPLQGRIFARKIAKNEPFPEIENEKKEEKLKYFHNVIGNFVDEYVLPVGDKEKLVGEKQSDDDQTLDPDRIR